MFISNLNKNDSRFYYCNKYIGKYLERKGFPILSRQGDLLIFSKTKELQKAITSMPFYIKMFEKVGEK